MSQNILGNHSDLDCFDYSIILPNGYKQDKQNSYDHTFRLKWPNNYYDFDGKYFVDFKCSMIFIHGHKLIYFRHYLSDDHNFLMPVYSVCNFNVYNIIGIK